VEQLLIQDIALSYSRKKGRFLLSVKGQDIEQNVCEFLQTMSFLVGQNIEEYLLDVDSRFDTVRIPLTGTGKTITLDLVHFIQLREAYNRQMFLLKLEDLLLHKGIQMPGYL
jgi:hypothetical protein